MKNTSILLIVVVILTVLMVTACSTPPPPVSRVELDSARTETLAAEETASKSDREKKTLEDELARKEAELRSLQQYERQLGL